MELNVIRLIFLAPLMHPLQRWKRCLVRMSTSTVFNWTGLLREYRLLSYDDYFIKYYFQFNKVNLFCKGNVYKVYFVWFYSIFCLWGLFQNPHSWSETRLAWVLNFTSHQCRLAAAKKVKVGSGQRTQEREYEGSMALMRRQRTKGKTRMVQVTQESVCSTWEDWPHVDRGSLAVRCRLSSTQEAWTLLLG